MKVIDLNYQTAELAARENKGFNSFLDINKVHANNQKSFFTFCPNRPFIYAK